VVDTPEPEPDYTVPDSLEMQLAADREMRSQTPEFELPSQSTEVDSQPADITMAEGSAPKRKRKNVNYLESGVLSGASITSSDDAKFAEDDESYAEAEKEAEGDESDGIDDA
jgi:hypothetical protein